MASTDRFVILAAPRTGSNLLCTLLNAHPQILCHHEVFNPNGIFLALDRRHSAELGSLEERDRDPVAFLDRIWTSADRQRCVGFKMTRGQSPAIMDRVLRDRAIKIIVLRRRNRLKTYVSTVLAEKTGIWEAYSENDLVAERPKVRVDLESLQAHVESNERFYSRLLATLTEAAKSHLEVVYEELLSEAEQRRLLEYLRVSWQVLEPTSVKQNPSDLRRLIRDYQGLRQRLRGTPYHEELHDLGD